MTPLAQLRTHAVLPVIIADDRDCADSLGDALVAGGLPLAEVTLRTPAALDVIRVLAQRTDILVGAGTVLTADQVDASVDAGAAFIVSPGLSRAVVGRCLDRAVLPIPGAVTATEVQAALEFGLDTVKFFPAESAGGSAAISALAAPFASMSFVPTGGVNESNLDSYLALPSVIAVGGSWMVPRELVRSHDVAGLVGVISSAVVRVKNSRPH
ncbi:MAG TPA: bifunctional 4-hydroxy-2-oxoglutarate aldolase/2-dehydro-3-deoxy-phosphogluconate aldolase [Acidothermaceae bacterium]